MKSMLTAFAALTALALPAGLPTVVLAQDEAQAEQSQPPSDAGARYQPDEPSAPPVRNWVEPRAEVQPAQDGRGDWGSRDGDGNGRDRGDDGQGEGGGDFSQGPTGWNPQEPEAPVLPPPPQDWGDQGRDRDPVEQEQDWTRGYDGRDRDGGGNNDRRDWNGDNGGWTGGGQEYAPSQDGPQRVAPRGSFADSCSGSYVNQGRLYADCRDTRGNVRGTSIELARCSSSDIGNDNGLLVCHNVRGDFENRGGNNGGWDRDRNGGGRHWNDRNGRRDYGGWDNRWNQNDWRRSWNRGRSNEWWRNDRSFRGYSGYRFGYYFAPNYGYYSVPRNYIGQRWYRGDYLPRTFWRYRLNDYRTFGLGYPPPGTQWVAVDTTIYLIDSYDGYILEAVNDAWRW